MTVKSACHNPEGAEAAFSCPLCKLRINGKKPRKIRTAKSLSAFLVKDRAFLGKSIRPVSLQLMGKVSRSDIHRTASQKRSRPRYTLAEGIVLCRRHA